MFFPFVAAALAVVGGLLPGLIIMQTAKEAALLRALGTTKNRVRTMLAGQQLLLCIFGLLAGGAALLIYNGIERLSGIFEILLICAAINAASFIIASISCAIAVSRKKVLELLQTKE
jgi:ABC-type antimicrobial peptide transport system permease subunit